MAWSWSHAAEAYAYAQEQVQKQDRSWLEVVFAEWRAGQEKGGVINPVSTNFHQRKYDRALKYAKALPPGLGDEVLAEFVWEKMSEFATCTNGGWEAWCCPFGCMSHMVPFSPK
jgi:hypothetical protein